MHYKMKMQVSLGFGKKNFQCFKITISTKNFTAKVFTVQYMKASRLLCFITAKRWPVTGSSVLWYFLKY